MKTYKTTLEQVETLSGLKKNFNNLNPQLISRIVEEIKNNMLNNKVVIEGLLQLEAPGNLIEIRDNLLIDIDLMLIECKNKPFEKQDEPTVEPEPTKEYQQAHIFPVELQTDEAKQVIAKAVELNLCSVDNGVYSWGKTKALLAYFADRASEYLQLGKGIYDDKIKISWKPFEMLFGIKGLAQSKKDYQRTGNTPIGFDIVEKIFD